MDNLPALLITGLTGYWFLFSDKSLAELIAVILMITMAWSQ